MAEDNVFPFVSKPAPESESLSHPIANLAAATFNDTPDNDVARRAKPKEMVKVSANLMEELVNLAGETSLNRGRVEEQMNDMSYSLDDMSQAVSRLQEQLRRLDIETEAQIFRQEQLGEREDFDPLGNGSLFTFTTIITLYCGVCIGLTGSKNHISE